MVCPSAPPLAPSADRTDSLNFSPSAQTVEGRATEVSARERGAARPHLHFVPPLPLQNVDCPFYNHQMAAQGLQASLPTVTA